MMDDIIFLGLIAILWVPCIPFLLRKRIRGGEEELLAQLRDMLDKIDTEDNEK